MFVSRLALGALAAAYLAAPASAADKPLRTLLGGSPAAAKAPKTYPLAESRYIKQFAGPSISCGACFGYYHTQWRTWGEACNEPQPVDPGPQKMIEPVEPVPVTVPEIEKPAVPKSEKPKEPAPAPMPMPKEKLPDPKPPEKKKVQAMPSIPAPLPAVQSPASNPIQIAIPAAPQLVPALPAIPTPSIPTIIVPLSSK